MCFYNKEALDKYKLADAHLQIVQAIIIVQLGNVWVFKILFWYDNVKDVYESMKLMTLQFFIATLKKSIGRLAL